MSFNHHFARNQHGSVLVEVTVLIPILFIFIFGVVDFLFAFYEWNATTKAVELGARIAALSDPVAPELHNISGLNPPTVMPGDPMPDFQVTCDGAAKSCTCTRGACTGTLTYDVKAMNKIVCGRNSTSDTECNYSTGCFDGGGNYFLGMCDLFPTITAANVKIVYTQTGLGIAGRPHGPVPTVSVSLQNVPFQYFFLRFGLININQALPTTITGEILSSSAQPPP